MKNKLFIGLFIIIFFGTAYIQYKNTFPKKDVVRVSYVTVNQTVSYDEKKLSSPTRIQQGSTALKLLQSTHTVITKGEGKNAFVVSISGRVAQNEKREFWAFYVNGEQAVVGAGSYIMKNNDTIEWKIETY